MGMIFSTPVEREQKHECTLERKWPAETMKQEKQEKLDLLRGLAKGEQILFFAISPWVKTGKTTSYHSDSSN